MILLNGFITLFALHVSAQFISASLGIDGLTCSACSYGVEKALRNLDFVSDVKTDLNAATAEISFVPGKKISFDALAKKVSQAGFSVRFIKATYSFSQPRKVINDTLILDSGIFCFVSPPGAEIRGEITFQFLNGKFLDRKSSERWESEVAAARLKHPMLRSDTYFIQL
jgi:copper chaperone CopZ